MNYIDPCCGPRFSWAHHVSPGAQCADHIPQCGTVRAEVRCWSCQVPAELRWICPKMGDTTWYNHIQPISWIYSAFTIIYDHIHGENDDINSIPWGDLQSAGLHGISGLGLSDMLPDLQGVRFVTPLPGDLDARIGNDPKQTKKGSDMTPEYQSNVVNPCKSNNKLSITIHNYPQYYHKWVIKIITKW